MTVFLSEAVQLSRPDLKVDPSDTTLLRPTSVESYAIPLHLIQSNVVIGAIVKSGRSSMSDNRFAAAPLGPIIVSGKQPRSWLLLRKRAHQLVVLGSSDLLHRAVPGLRRHFIFVPFGDAGIAGNLIPRTRQARRH